jgi:tetratricopeptide (TPR) repeat protein
VRVTSRHRLAGRVARDGARPLALDVLTPAEAETLLRRLLGEQRVLREPSATAELARACGFLPLALRIAAAHLTTRPHQPLTDYLADLGRTDRLAALRVDGDPESAVSVAFDQSYQALDPGTRKLFRLLAFAPGADITVPAAAMLAGRPEHTTAVQLNRLVGVHMISEPSAARFTLHDLLRLYARQRADAEDGPDECAHAAGRLIHWYADMAAAAVAVLCPQFVRLPGTLPSRPFQESAAALAWLDAERANLVAAATTDGPPEAAWRLADALRGYFRLRRIGVDWLVTAQAGLAAAEAAEHPAGVAAARLSLADAYWSTGRHADAEEHYARALRSATDIGWVPGTAAVLTNLGTLHWELGRLEQATECYTAALARNREAGLVAGQAADLNNLGMVHRQLGRLTEAVDFHSRALHTHEAAGSRVGVGNALANLGVAYRLLGRLDDAVTKCTESLAVHREFGSRAAEAQIIGDLAEVHLLRGDPARAAAMLDEALGMQREIDHRRGEAATLYLLALTHRDRDDTEAALRHARAAAALAVDTGNTRSAALAMTLVASVEGRLGDETAALAGHAEALDVARSVRSHDAEADALIGWAETALRHSATDAHGYASAALALVSASGHRLLEARALTVLARIERTRGDETAAADYTQRALVIDRETGLSAGPFKAGRPSESAG